MYIKDFMPMMADVVSGNVPRPVELPSGLPATSHVSTPDGEVYWPDAAPAWRGLSLDTDRVCIVARRDRDSVDRFCPRVCNAVDNLRQLLGEDGPAVCDRGRVIVFNSDGTRAAMEDKYALLMTTEDVAEWFGVSERRARALIKNRHERFGIGTQIGNTWLVHRDELDVLEPDERFK